MNDLDHEQITELIAMHALDALPPSEAATVEEHAVTCLRCSSELAAFREAISLVANSGGDAPAHLWDAISSQLEHPRQADDQPAPPSIFSPRAKAFKVSRLSRHSRIWRRRPWSTGAVAAALVAIAALGIEVGNLDQQVAQLKSSTVEQLTARGAQGALADPQARHIVLESAQNGGSPVGEIAILPSGDAFFVNRTLPRLARSETYQLWGQTPNAVVSLGVIGSSPSDVAFHIDPSATIEAFALTTEQAGGVVQPTHSPVAVSKQDSRT